MKMPPYYPSCSRTRCRRSSPCLVVVLLAILCCHGFTSFAAADSHHGMGLSNQWSKFPSFHRRKTDNYISRRSYYLALRGGDGSVNEVTVPSPNKQTTASSPNQQSPFEYIPITALDDYGQSTQLRHAMESANRFGTPVLACICCHDENDNSQSEENQNDEGEQRVENAIVVCSLQRPRPGVIVSPSASTNSLSARSSKSLSLNSIHPSIQGMVRLLATRDDMHHPAHNSKDDIPQHALHTAIITTGIQSDANFLLNQLQSHIISKYWFRYDTLPSTSSSHTMTMVKMVRDVLLDCLGYDWGDEMNSGKVSGGIGSAAPSYDEQGGEDAQRAGRPLGVCTFLLGLDSTTSTTTLSSQHPYLTVVKANGASQQYVAHAMGMGSELANDKLAQQWKRCMSRDEAVDMMKEILSDVAKERGWLPPDDDDVHHGGTEPVSNGLTVACETVTSKGIDIEFLPL